MNTTKISDTELGVLSAAYPRLPTEYFSYLRDVGWGEAASGRTIYSGPIASKDIYGAAFSRAEIVLLGDDFQGYCFGYDTTTSTYGEVTPDGIWQAWPAGKGLRHYTGTYQSV